MTNKSARADVAMIRQENQFTCCAASISSCLKAHEKDATEADVNKILGAAPMAGASWEAMLTTVQYFGMRGTLIVPATPRMLKEYTDRGIPLVIAWNPEDRPWSRASVVFDVQETESGLEIHIMDPNIPNPAKTVRVLSEDEFCRKWVEKVSDSLIMRRPAMAVEREISAEGRQMKASSDNVPPLNWQPVGNEGWKAIEPDMRAYVLRKKVYEEYQDRNIPSWEELTQGEENQDDADWYRMDELHKKYKQWVRQGWWPRHREATHWMVTVHLKGIGEFEAELADPKEALKKTEEAIPRLKKRLRPSWMTKVAEDQNMRTRNLKDAGDRWLNQKELGITPTNHVAASMSLRGGSGAGSHHTRERDVERGVSRKAKHKDTSPSRVAHRFLNEGE